MPNHPKSAEPLIELALHFEFDGGALMVERKKTKGAFKYRLHYYDCIATRGDEKEGDAVQDYSKWFPDLEQALASSRWRWYMMSLVEIGLGLTTEELRRIIKTSPAVNSYFERFPDQIHHIAALEERLSREDKLRDWASHIASVPAGRLWSQEDEALGMTEGDRAIVVARRLEDCAFNGTDGYEPSEAKEILDRYRSRTVPVVSKEVE